MTHSVIAIVKGGLGNQLFIYAAARALALRTGRQLFLDHISGYQRDTYQRSFLLNHFPIQAEFAPREWIPWPALRHPRHKVVRTWNKMLPRPWRTYYAERHNLSAEQLTQLSPRRERILLNGHWQSENYFKDFGCEIRRELAAPRPTDNAVLRLGDEMASGESVFLHVRRIRYNPALDVDYYQQAIDAAQTRLNKPRFYVFGDDLNWPMRMLSFGQCPCHFVEEAEGDELGDLWMMIRCRHAIVANSSFSWWGAWLGGEPSRERHVCFPKQPGWPVEPASDWQLVANVL